MSERPAGEFPILEMGALIEQAGDNPARAAKLVADALWAQGYRKPHLTETPQSYYTMECRECGIEEGLSEDREIIDERASEHNTAYH